MFGPKTSVVLLMRAALREIHIDVTLIYYPGRVTGALPNDCQEPSSCSINLGHVTGALQYPCAVATDQHH